MKTSQNKQQIFIKSYRTKTTIEAKKIITTQHPAFLSSQDEPLISFFGKNELSITVNVDMLSWETLPKAVKRFNDDKKKERVFHVQKTTILTTKFYRAVEISTGLFTEMTQQYADALLKASELARKMSKTPQQAMQNTITFYIVREPAVYGNAYNLCSYIPRNAGLCWSFYSDDPADFNIHITIDEALKIERKLGFDVQPGTCVNLTTTRVIELSDAKSVYDR